MPKTRKKAVERVGIDSEHEQDLYSIIHRARRHVTNKPQLSPHNPQATTPTLSTFLYRHFNLLTGHLSTLYTGLITNTTIYI